MLFLIILIFIIILLVVYVNNNKKAEMKENNCFEDEKLSEIIDNYSNNNTSSIDLENKIKIGMEQEKREDKESQKNNDIDINIPNSINEISNNQYEVLKRLNNSHIKYALTGIINMYHGNLSELVQAFKNLELIRYSNLEESMQQMTIKELKEYLRDKKLKLTGNKKELIERLIPNLDDNTKKKILIKNKCYILTEEGNRLLKDYKSRKEAEFEDMFSYVIESFKERKFSEGYKKICEHNIKYNSIGGINFNWKEEMQKGLKNVDYKVMSWFLNKKMEFVSNIPEDDFKAIICFIFLSGKSYNDILKLIEKKYGSSDITENIQYYSIMLSNEREALDMENLNMEYYEILDTEDSCSKCKNKAHKKLKLSERKIGINFPPICKECKCTIVAYFDEDT